LFESYEEAEQALKETLLAATAQNSKWPEKFIYKIVPVEVTAPHPKPEQEPDDLTIAYMSGFHDGKNTPQRKPEQEPVAWMDEYGDVLSASAVDGNGLRNIPLYTTPPRREWVGLTVKDIEWCFYDANDARIVAARSIETNLREKNGC
jgi:hypothetical protein